MHRAAGRRFAAGGLLLLAWWAAAAPIAHARPALEVGAAAVAAQTALQRGSVIARLDRPSIAIDETVTLTVTAVDVDGELDTAALEAEFDIVGRSRSSQVDVLNGARRSTLSWALELSPRRVGVFTVPPVRVGPIESDLQTLAVTEPASGSDRLLFLETEVDTRRPWVQSQVLLTLRVFDAVGILEGSIGEPGGDDLIVQRLGTDEQSVVQRHGRRYTVVERRYAVFPQSSGPLTIDPVTLSAAVSTDASRARGFFTPSRRVTRRTAPIVLDVRARPDEAAGWWLPARDVDIESAWPSAGSVSDAGDTPTDAAATLASSSPPSASAEAPARATVGVPLTRTLTLRALGVLQTQLPEIAVPEVDGASLYADAPQTRSAATDEGVRVERRLSWAIIPERPGPLVLPPISVSWFDTSRGGLRAATLPSTTLEVVAGPVAADLQVAPLAPGGDDAFLPDGTLVPPAAGGDVGTVPGLPVGGLAGGQAAAVGDTAEPAALAGFAGLQQTIATLEARVWRWRTLATLALGVWVSSALVMAWLFCRRRRADSAAPPDREGGGASRRRPRVAADTAGKLAELREALAVTRQAGPDPAGDALRRSALAVLSVGAAVYPAAPPRTLSAFAARLDGDAPRTLRRLEAALYGRQDITRPAASLGLDGLADELERALADAGGDRGVDGRGAARGSQGEERLPTL